MRMNWLDWLRSKMVPGTVHKRERAKATGRKPTLYTVTVPYRTPFTVLAMTKSEARAKVKVLMNRKHRLPPGTTLVA